MLFPQQMYYIFNNEQVWDIFMTCMILLSFLFLYVKTFNDVSLSDSMHFMQLLQLSLYKMIKDISVCFIKPCQGYSAFSVSESLGCVPK